MINLNNYKNKTEELKNIHKYVSKKLILLYIIFGLMQAFFLVSIIAYSATHEGNINVLLILLLLFLWMLSLLMFIPIVKHTNNFTIGNLTDFVFDIVSYETGLSIRKNYDKKEANRYIKDNTNILYGNSASINLNVDVLDESQNVMAKFMFVTISYNRYLSYIGYLIIIPSKLATNDTKYFTKKFTSFSIDYKKDKENSDDLTHIYYNKKTDYVFDQNLVNLHKYIDGYYNEYLSNKMSIGLLSKNNHLSIMFANNPKVHPNFTFKHKLTDEYLEKLVNSIIKDIELIKEIYNK